MDQLTLIVDDDPLIRQLLGAILDEMGLAHHEACNGSEALSMVAEGTYDVIFMDCLMPEMDGFDATRHIRRLGHRIPIIAITASCNENECAEAGMNYFISKPITRSDVRLACEFLNLPLGQHR